MKRFEITTNLDALTAKQLLQSHQNQLTTLTDQRAINWTKGCINELEAELEKWDISDHTRGNFKEAYYGLGDKIQSLLDIRSEMAQPAADEMQPLIVELEKIHTKLAQWGGKFLTKWD
jgi:hypothetical protein